MHFAQTVAACIAVLPTILSQEEQTVSSGQSLGPRLATDLYRQMNSWVKQSPRGHREQILRRIKRSHLVEGLANPKWKVDFFYEPLLRIPAQTPAPPVVLITVDLGVKEPLFKAEHAVTMSRDIALKTKEHDVRLAFAGNGRRDESLVAKNVIKSLSDNVYRYFDLDEPEEKRAFTTQIRSEIVGEPWIR
jgi:hypothetical protein